MAMGQHTYRTVSSLQKVPLNSVALGMETQLYGWDIPQYATYITDLIATRK